MTSSPPSNDAAVLVSGGVDSAVLSVDLLREFGRVFPIYVRFGLRWEGVEHAWLERYLAAVARSHPGIQPLTILDEPIAAVYAHHWSASRSERVPDAATEDSAVYLPGRNVLLGSQAAVWCRLREVRALAYGILGGNPFPDSTPEFFRDFEAVLNRAMDGRLTILTPFAGLSKVDVIRRGASLPLHLTFSCLDPVSGSHCGDCNKCEERRKAFRLAGVADRTEYARPQA
ncbi:MAG: 7-cyano-7-deazaguanine synthase [Isosphaeraceae bacterium]